MSIFRKTKVIVIFLLLSCLSFAAVARENVIDNRRGIFHPVIATQGMVSTQEKCKDSGKRNFTVVRYVLKWGNE